MRDESALYFIAALVTGLAIAGLFMWARATDTGVAIFGCSLLAFGFVFNCWLLNSWCDRMEPIWANGNGK